MFFNVNMDFLLFFNEYFFFLIYISICFFIAIALYLLSVFMIPKWIDDEKISAYECGFSPSGDARNKIEIKFYLTAILFLVFDVEVVFLFPWVLIFSKLSSDLFSFWIMIFFFFILLIGYIYEWLTGAMDW